jgi:hypothetical protein
MRARFVTQAALVITSDTVHPKEIQSRLRLRATQSVTKGTATGRKAPATHPMNIVVVASRLPRSVNMSEHLDEILSLIASRKAALTGLRHCVAEIHVNCSINGEGGWTFEPSILERLAKAHIKLVVSISC